MGVGGHTHTHTHGSLDGGCHGFLSKALGIMAHPLLMSALEEGGGGVEGVERGRGRDEGKGKGREGKRGGEGESRGGGGSLLLMIIE